MNKIAVLITCHNRRTKTLDCLNTLFKQKGINSKYVLDVFLVDDGSTDGTAYTVNNDFPEVHVIKGSGNLYWNRGMHLAWSEAVKSNKHFDYFLWLNDDVVLYSDALIHLMECAKKTNSKALICGILESHESSSVISYGGGNLKNKIYIPNLPNNEFNSCEIINGNCVLISKNIFDQLGNIDPVFPHSLGDHDYALRAKKQGITTYTTQQFIGSCPKNDSLPKWCLVSVPFKQRIKSLYSPLGNSHPYYYFIFEARHYGLIMALKHFASIHLRLLLPQLWIQK